ncbi:MAG: hypothetical protein MK108_05100 [Mariniblastus sp.]|nr:hypothetical protein [Mariniblastus sp.]
MSQCRFNKPQLDLSRRPEQGPWLVDMQSFFELSFWIAEELIDLEMRFQPVAKRVKLRYQAVNRAG